MGSSEAWSRSWLVAERPVRSAELCCQLTKKAEGLCPRGRPEKAGPPVQAWAVADT